MRTNKKTIKLAKIRRYLRDVIRWHDVYGGTPSFYSSDDYKRSRKIKDGTGLSANKPYYSKTERAITDIAEKIYNLLKEEK